jgi:hypothetical protein
MRRLNRKTVYFYDSEGWMFYLINRSNKGYNVDLFLFK